MRRSVLRSQLGRSQNLDAEPCLNPGNLFEIILGIETTLLGLQFASTLPVKSHDLLNLHMISLPGSGVMLIKVFITVYDLILSRRHFLRGLIKAGMETPVFPMLFSIHWCLEAQSGPVSIQDSS